MLSRFASRIFAVDGRRFYSRGVDPLTWDVVSAVCLERRPLITKELTSLEKDMLALFYQIDKERSLMSDYELKEREESGGSSQDSSTATKTQKSSILAMRDIMDAWEKELQEVTLSSSSTEADKTQDVKSILRKLDNRLFLLVKQNDTGNRWLFPQGICEDGETLRESAERVLKLHCGPDLKARFLSNAPCGFFKYMYPKSYRSKDGSPDGAKVFFYKAELIDGNVKSDEYQWQTKSELLSIVDKKYAKSLDKFMFNDS